MKGFGLRVVDFSSVGMLGFGVRCTWGSATSYKSVFRSGRLSRAVMICGAGVSVISIDFSILQSKLPKGGSIGVSTGERSGGYWSNWFRLLSSPVTVPHYNEIPIYPHILST